MNPNNKNIMQNIYIFILSIIFLSLIFIIIKSKQRIQTKRLFIALDIPYTYKLGINKVQKFLKRKINEFKEQNPHTTLIFLGNTSINDIDKIITTMQISLNEFEKNKKIGTHALQPGAKILGKNAIALEYSKTSSLNDLNVLVNILKKNLELSNVGINNQSANFKAHLTLGRFHSNLNTEQALLLDQINVPIDQKTHLKEFTPKAITLYESKNGKYIPLKTLKFS